MRKILNNIFSLSLGELFLKFFNIITFAYLARIIFPSGFGTISFATAFVSFFILFVNYGFDTVAIREISNSPEKLPDYVVNITFLRFVLGLITYGILFLIVAVIDQNSINKQAITIYGLAIFSNALLINWVYRAIEKTFPIVFAQFVSGLFNLIAVILLIHKPHQLITTIWIFVISGYVNSIIMIFLLRKYTASIHFALNYQLIKKIFIQASPIAFSLFMVSIYYNMDQVMLGFMTSQTEVGFYSASYKILIVAIIPASIIVNAFFPQLSKTAERSEERNELMHTYSLLMIGTGLFIGIFGILFSEEIISIIYGPAFLPGATLLVILMINSILVFINMTYGNPLLAWNLEKKYLTAISLGAVSNIILNFILIPIYRAQGAAIATLCSELVVLFGVVYFHYCYTRKLYLRNLINLFGISLFTFTVGKITLAQYQNSLLTIPVVTIAFISGAFVCKLISFEQLKKILHHEI